jgi:hypothetical protein
MTIDKTLEQTIGGLKHHLEVYNANDIITINTTITLSTPITGYQYLGTSKTMYIIEYIN